MATRFVKYKIQITKITNTDYIRDSYNKISDTGNEKNNGPVYGYVKEHFTRDDETNLLVMEMENETLNIKDVVKAILG